MTVQSAIARLEKIRGIAHQDLSIFQDTPIRNILKHRKEAAILIDKGADYHQEESLMSIVDNCEVTIKKYLYL